MLQIFSRIFGREESAKKIWQSYNWKGDIEVSGVFHKGRWYENTDMACRRCGNPVYESDNPEYRYQCFQCDEDLYSFEVIRQERKEYQNGHR